MWSKKFILDLVERAIKTFAQSLAACLTTVVMSLGSLNDVNWPAAISIAVLATIYSVLTSVASSGVKNEDTASLVQ